MAKVITAKDINLVQLDKELGSYGLCIDKNDLQNKIIVTADHSLITQEQLETAILNHVAIFKVPTLAEKLALVGLSLEELRAAL
jgi:hypothetical protein